MANLKKSPRSWVKKKRTTYPDGSAIPRHLQQAPSDRANTSRPPQQQIPRDKQPSDPKRKFGGRPGIDPPKKSMRDKVDFERWKIQRKKQSEKPVHPLNKFGYKKRKGMNIGGRANLLEEMGRIDARKHPDAADRAEKSRVISELNRGYNKGGRIGFKDGTKMVEIPVNKPIGRGGRMSIEKVPSGGKKHMSYLKSKTNPDSPFFVREPMKKGGLIKGKPKLAKRGWK